MIPFFYTHVTQEEQKAKKKKKTGIMTVHILKKVRREYNRTQNIKGNKTV